MSAWAWRRCVIVGLPTLGLVFGCNVTLPAAVPGTSTTHATSTSTTGAPAGADTTGSSGEPDPGGVIFLDGLDGGGIAFECDLLADDCPVGETCRPWANDGGRAWNATRCSPLAIEPGAPGESCSVVGSAVSGIDTCQPGSTCWRVDPDTLEGTCVSLCTAADPELLCDDPDEHCVVSNNEAIILCLPTCDPVAPDCGDDEACVPSEQGPWFCAPAVDAGPVPPEPLPCEFTNACPVGMVCALADATAGCSMVVGCCTTPCDLWAEATCADPAQTCVPAYERGTAPPGLEHVGLCSITDERPEAGWWIPSVLIALGG